MKVLILSDIHSNIYALEAIWKKERDCSLIYCVGDLVDYGPYPKQVLDWIRAHQVKCVQGNHDQWVVMNGQDASSLRRIPYQERGWVHHNASLLDQSDFEFLTQLPKSIVFDLDGITYAMTHLYHDYEEIVSLYAYHQFLNREFYCAETDSIHRLILGHTHRQAVRYLSDQTLWLNPGSVSYRRRDDPDQSAHYAIITDGTIQLRRLSYDLAPLRRDIESIRLKESEAKVAQWMFGER
jgi:putative phosphoesterase